MKSNPQGAVLKQQASRELNKRRTLLQDNSWIKSRPEEEKDENYGKAALNRHNSHDALHRKIKEKDEPKAVLSRYRSDDTLDRISDRNDAAKTSKASTLDSRLTNRSVSTFRSSDASKSHPGSLLSASTSKTTGFSPAASPVKKKRQSWFPPPPPGYSTTPSTEASRRNPAVHPPIPPKPSSPISSSKPLRQENREIPPSKLGMSTETKRFTERNTRTQDLDDMVKETASLQETDKGKELDNIIKMNKSLSRNQGLDGLFRTKWKAEQIDKRAKSLESLIYMNTQMDRDGKGNQSLGNFNRVNQRTDKSEKGSRDLESIMKVNIKTEETKRGKQDFDGFIKVNPETNKSIKSSQSLGNLIEVSPEGNRSRQGGQSLDCLIKVVPEMNQGNREPDNLIKMNPSTDESEQCLDEQSNINLKAVKNTASDQYFDKQIKVNTEILTNNQRNEDLDNLIKVNPSITRSDQSLDLDNLIQLKPSALRNVNRDRDSENVTEANSHMSEKKVKSSSTGTRHARPKDTVMYTRTYVENSEIPKNGYQENSSGKYIQTVYSTSDRSVIERDMCTYCRKPLGVETKMILDELQICCHSTCFKCEICKRPLENLKAGDSIWIYRQTIHCEPCYSKVMAKWIQ
ncbi:sciellin isoform X2 [Octodon degus]|uniref:Sciellin n=1 Tax=Octodon degus TaxID=10160 RepID=A0A6P6E081_OCTDE|nr:sciellin isoform X2 [Octodon degus]